MDRIDLIAHLPDHGCCGAGGVGTATRPAEAWLGQLSEGDRLILPLTTNKGFVDNDPPVPIERL